MRSFQKHSGTGKGLTVDVSFNDGVIYVFLDNYNYDIKDKNRSESYKIDAHNGSLLKKHYNKLYAYKSVAALVKYAKANQIQQDAVTPCPVPAPAPAKSAAKGQGILFVEVETEGRGKDAEITEISVVSINETVLFHSFVRPAKPKSNVSMGAPTFDKLWKSFSDVIGRADIAFYNADHTKRMLLQSIAKAFDTPKPEHFYTLFPYNKVICIGERYEIFNNYRLGYFRNYGLQHINSACGQSGLFWRDVKNTPSGNAIKSARLYKYLDHRQVV